MLRQHSNRSLPGTRSIFSGPLLLLSLNALAVALVLAPSPVRAQGLGVVTTLTGTATLARASQSQPLRFRDSLFEQDKIATAEKSLVRVLLGGKAVVTIRELSELTITEGHAKSIIQLSAGKIGLAVARQRMQPGEEIEVRTPNAVAAVRGTVFVVELIRPAKGGASGSAPFVTNVLVVKGIVDVIAINAPPGTAPTRVGAGQSVGVTAGTAGQVQPVAPAAMASAFSDLSARETDHPRSADAVARSVSGAEGLKARALALALSPDPTAQPSGPRGGEGLPGGQTQAGGQPDPAADVFGLAQLAAVGEDTAGVGGGRSGLTTRGRQERPQRRRRGPSRRRRQGQPLHERGQDQPPVPRGRIALARRGHRGRRRGEIGPAQHRGLPVDGRGRAHHLDGVAAARLHSRPSRHGKVDGRAHRALR